MIRLSTENGYAAMSELPDNRWGRMPEIAFRESDYGDVYPLKIPFWRSLWQLLRYGYWTRTNSYYSDGTGRAEAALRGDEEMMVVVRYVWRTQ